jgi:heme O synthase-like polyprenyltransferase
LLFAIQLVFLISTLIGLYVVIKELQFWMRARDVLDSANQLGLPMMHVVSMVREEKLRLVIYLIMLLVIVVSFILPPRIDPDENQLVIVSRLGITMVPILMTLKIAASRKDRKRAINIIRHDIVQRARRARKDRK